MRATISLALMVSLVPAQDGATSGTTPVPQDRRAGFESIDAEQCRVWLTKLASDEFAGRETGTEGYEKAATYVAARFEEFGLEPAGDDKTYFQAVPWERITPVPAESWISLHDEAEDGEVCRIAAGKGLSGSLGEASQAKYGLTVVRAKSADDVRDLKLDGNAVLLVDQSDRPAARGRRRFSMLSFRLARAGAGAVITVDDAAAARDPAAGARTQYAGGGAGRRTRGRFRMPNSYTVTKAAAEKLLAAAGVGAGVLDGEPGVVPVEGFRLQTNITVKREKVFAANVVGLLRGRDPKLRDEMVGIGSHLDHIGKRGDQINNGADDDGSGTTGVLAIARAFAKNGQKPRRSILFMCFSGEEKGLIGSRWYTQHPIFPNEKMVAEIQMDMIGRNEERVDRRSGEVVEGPEENENTLHLVGTKKLSNELHELCLAMNEKHAGFEFEYDEEDVFYRSDHANFARVNIPIVFFFTGFHPQYHRPDDTVEKINFPKLARVAKLAYLVGFELAERETRPKLDRTWKEVEASGRRRR